MRVTIYSMENESQRRQVAREAKSIVALAFRNGPIENIHAGRPCPTCSGQAGYSRITDAEMKGIMRNAVNRLYALLLLKSSDPDKYESKIRFGERYTANWDEPTMPEVQKDSTEVLSPQFTATFPMRSDNLQLEAV